MPLYAAEQYDQDLIKKLLLKIGKVNEIYLWAR